MQFKCIKSRLVDGIQNLLVSRAFVSCPLELAGFLLSVPGSPRAVTVTSDHLFQVVGFIFCSGSLIRTLVLQGWGERKQSRLKSCICLKGTEVLFSISECLYCHAVGGFKTPECVIPSFLIGAVPLEDLIILPTGLLKEEKKAIALPSGEGTGASLPRQVNVELDCRSSLPYIR